MHPGKLQFRQRLGAFGHMEEEALGVFRLTPTCFSSTSYGVAPGNRRGPFRLAEVPRTKLDITFCAFVNHYEVEKPIAAEVSFSQAAMSAPPGASDAQMVCATYGARAGKYWRDLAERTRSEHNARSLPGLRSRHR